VRPCSNLKYLEALSIHAMHAATLAVAGSQSGSVVSGIYQAAHILVPTCSMLALIPDRQSGNVMVVEWAHSVGTAAWCTLITLQLNTGLGTQACKGANIVDCVS
jgi:hypothetical protein